MSYEIDHIALHFLKGNYFTLLWPICSIRSLTELWIIAMNSSLFFSRPCWQKIDVCDNLWIFKCKVTKWALFMHNFSYFTAILNHLYIELEAWYCGFFFQLVPDDASKLADFQKLVKHTSEFETILKDLKFISSDSKDERLSRFADNVEVHFASRKKVEILTKARNVLLQSDFRFREVSKKIYDCWVLYQFIVKFSALTVLNISLSRTVWRELKSRMKKIETLPVIMLLICFFHLRNVWYPKQHCN